MIRIFIKNNVEDPIESVGDAQFTSVVHKGMRNLRLDQVYPLQSYSWLVKLLSNQFSKLLTEKSLLF